MKSQGLPAAHRLRSRRDFERAYAEGYKVVTPYFALYARANGLPHSRIGVTATRRLGKSVRRNRGRRLVREAFRANRSEMPQGYDFVVVVRWPLLDLNAPELGSHLVPAAHRAVARG